MARIILVADDSPTVQKKASGILTGEGLEVVTVSNGVAAVKKLSTVKPLVVLADVSMPGKDGYEVCEFIKSASDLRHIPVVLIFSDTDPYEEQRGSRAGADGKIKKPFDRDELIATVSKLVAQAEAAMPKAAAPPPPTPAVVVEPVDEEPELAARPQGPDFSAFSEGVAFGVPASEEPAPAAEPPSPAAETFVDSEIALEPSLESVMPAPEAVETPALEPPVAADPVYVEEQAAPPPSPEPEAERTMMFRAPAEIAEPILSDEAESAMPALEPPPAVEPTPEPDEAPAGGAAFAPKTLESYTLSEAATGQVRFEAAGAEVAPEPEPFAPPAPARTVDPEQVFSIVHKVVIKMSPPALSPQMIEDIARKFADEIIAELSSES